MQAEGPRRKLNSEPASREIRTTAFFSERARKLLEEPHKGVLAVSRPDSSILQTEMWYALREDGSILMNTTAFRRKNTYLRDNPFVSFLVSRGNYQYVTMNGNVALIDTPEVAQRDIRFLAERYLGKEEADKIMTEEFAHEERVSIILTPTKITEYFSE